MSGYLYEIIITDGGSNDHTLAVAAKFNCRITTGNPGRAIQLNAGARIAQGDLLYFLHADSFPPNDLQRVVEEFRQSTDQSASFQLSFKPSTWLLRQSSYFTRFDIQAFRFGDASLLVKQTTFKAISGYDESWHLMEDNDIIRRLRKVGGFKLFKATVSTSSRKYLEHGDWYLQLLYVTIYLLQRIGASQDQLVNLYRWALGK